MFFYYNDYERTIFTPYENIHHFLADICLIFDEPLAAFGHFFYHLCQSVVNFMSIGFRILLLDIPGAFRCGWESASAFLQAGFDVVKLFLLPIVEVVRLGTNIGATIVDSVSELEMTMPSIF